MATDKDQLFGKAKLIHDYRDAFDTVQGTNVLRHLMKTCYVLNPTFAPGDPTTTAFREGQRSVVLSIMRWAKKDWQTLMQELERTENHDALMYLPPPP